MQNNAETIFCNVFCVEESSRIKIKKHNQQFVFAVLIMQLPPQEGAPCRSDLVVRTLYIINV